MVIHKIGDEISFRYFKENIEHSSRLGEIKTTTRQDYTASILEIKNGIILASIIMGVDWHHYPLKITGRFVLLNLAQNTLESEGLYGEFCNLFNKTADWEDRPDTPEDNEKDFIERVKSFWGEEKVEKFLYEEEEERKRKYERQRKRDRGLFSLATGRGKF